PQEVRAQWRDHVGIVIIKNDALKVSGQTVSYTAYIGLHHLLPFHNPHNGKDELSGGIGGIRNLYLEWPTEAAVMAEIQILAFKMTEKLATFGLPMLPLTGTKTAIRFDYNAPFPLRVAVYESLGRILERFPLTTVGQD